MNIRNKLIAGLLMLFCLTAVASENKPVLIGFAEIPAIHEPMWDELIENGGSRQKGDTTKVTLYATPNNWHSAVLVIDNFSFLYASEIAHYDSPKAHVYGKVPGWYQLKTADNQLLWIPETDAVNFIDYFEALGDFVYSPPPWLLLSVNPSDDSELVEPHEDFLEIDSFRILERRAVNGEIWLRLKHVWDDLTHDGSGVSPQDDRFDYNGWVRAHDSEGEPIFLMLGPMC